VISALSAAIRAYRVSEHGTQFGVSGGDEGTEAGEDGKGETPTKKDTNLAAATCVCPRKIRVARSTLAAAPITCEACGEDFQADDAPDARVG
jgi:hypothetical protein